MHKTRTSKPVDKLLAYTRPISAFDGAETGYVYIFLDDDVIDSNMPVPEKNSILTIQDFAGNLLYCKDESGLGNYNEELITLLEGLDEKQSFAQKKVKLQGIKYMLISYKSESSGLRYSYLVPNNIINDRLMDCIGMLVLFIAVGVIADVVLSYYISKKNATPINDMLNKMSIKTEELEGHDTVISSIVNTVNDLVENNTDLSNAINMQKPYLKTAFVNRLLFSDFQNEKEITGMADYMKWPLEGRVFCVLLFRFHMLTDSLEETEQRFFNTFTASLAELIEKKRPDSLYTDLGEGQFALIMNESGDDPEGIKVKSENWFPTLSRKCRQSWPGKFLSMVEVLRRAQIKSLIHIRMLLTFATMRRREMKSILSGTVKEIIHSIGYPSGDMQVKLTHFVIAGDENGLHDYLKGIVTRFFIETDLPVYLQHVLITDLQIILIRLLEIIKLEDDEYTAYYAQLEKNNNMPVLSQITITLNLFRDICRFMNMQKKMQERGHDSQWIFSI